MSGYKLQGNYVSPCKPLNYPLDKNPFKIQVASHVLLSLFMHIDFMLINHYHAIKSLKYPN